MKPQVILLLVFTFITSFMFAQNTELTDPKNFRIHIGNKWFDYDAKIKKQDFKKITDITLQSKKGVERIAKTESYQWAILLRKKDGGFYAKSPIKVSEESIDATNSGDVFTISDIVVEGNDKNFPKKFRLFFE